MIQEQSPKWLAGFRSDYDKLFVKKWSSYMGAVLLMMVILGLMINGMVWGVFGGVKFWGDWFNNFIGLGPFLGLPLAALLFQKKVIDPYSAIPATFWLGSLLGGLIFGIGMIFSGGCASGSLWRMGEGHLKLWVSMFFFSWMGSTASALLKRFNLSSVDQDNADAFERTALGFQAYMPDMFSDWGVTFIVSASLLLLWYGLVRYNESTQKFTLM